MSTTSEINSIIRQLKKQGAPVTVTYILPERGGSIGLFARELAKAIRRRVWPKNAEQIQDSLDEIYEGAGLGPWSARTAAVPLRVPHHTVSAPGLLGGQDTAGNPRPGELQLASAGVLVLDDADEIPWEVLRSLERELEKSKMPPLVVIYTYAVKISDVNIFWGE